MCTVLLKSHQHHQILLHSTWNESFSSSCCYGYQSGFSCTMYLLFSALSFSIAAVAIACGNRFRYSNALTDPNVKTLTFI